MNPIDVKQIQLIHVAKAKLGISDDDYRTILQGQFKKQSCKELSYAQASRLVDYFKKELGFKISPRKRVTDGAEARVNRRQKKLPGNVTVLPTRDQLDMIAVLAGKIAWRAEGGFKRWMRKYMKFERVKSVEDAQRVIEGLKGMLAHQGGDKWGTG